MLNHQIIENNVLIKLKGRIDIANNADLSNELNELVSANPDKNIVIDLKDVEYISSSGLGAMVRLKRELAIANKELRLCSLAAAVLKVFEMSGMKEHFLIFNDEVSALKPN